MPNRLFYSAATQYENLGDIVLAVELIRRARLSGEVLVDDRGCPADYLLHLKLSSSESVSQSGAGFKRKLVKAALSSKFSRKRGEVTFLLKPGHQKNDVANVRQGFYVVWLVALRLLGVVVARYGTSIELPSTISAWFERAKARCFADYTLRDTASISLAKDAGVVNVRYFPDLALGLEYRRDESRPLICASFRNDLARSTEHSAGSASSKSAAIDVEQKARFLEAALSSCPGSRLVMVSQVYRDDSFNRALANRLNVEFVAFDGGEASKEQLFQLYSSSRLVVSNRLHVLLFGASRGAIPIPLVDLKLNAKVVNVLSTIGLGELICEDSDSEPFASHVEAILDAENVHQEAIERVFHEASEQVFFSTVRSKA